MSDKMSRRKFGAAAAAVTCFASTGVGISKEARGELFEPVPGPTTDAFAQRAKAIAAP